MNKIKYRIHCLCASFIILSSTTTYAIMRLLSKDLDNPTLWCYLCIIFWIVFVWSDYNILIKELDKRRKP